MLTQFLMIRKKAPCNMDICATFQLTAREYRSAVRSSPILRFRALLIICAVVVVIGLIELPSEGLTPPLYLGLSIPVCLEAFVHVAARSSAALFAEPWTVRVTDETFALRTAVSRAEVSWNAYSEAWERSGFWYLRQTSGASCFVPKRALDGTQQAELAEFFARRLPPSKTRWYNLRSWR